MFKKRILFIACLVLITVCCYIFMNRNYDPLARYAYDNEKIHNKIIKYMDEREIKYIIDYSIAPGDFMDYIENYNFNAYNISYYNKARTYLYALNPSQIVNVVEAMLKKDIDFDAALNEYMYLDYDNIIYRIYKKK